MDVTKFSTEELKGDFEDTIKDVVACAGALGGGVFVYSGGSVIDRIEGNCKIARVIRAELIRRGVLPPDNTLGDASGHM